MQIASDAAKGAGARLAGLEVPSYADTETTFDELQARIARTVEFLEGIREEQLDGAEERNVTLKVRGQEISFNGRDFLFGFALPNFFFHVTTAYAILRHNGVELGKMDFLGGAWGSRAGMARTRTMEWIGKPSTTPASSSAMSFATSPRPSA